MESETTQRDYLRTNTDTVKVVPAYNGLIQQAGPFDVSPIRAALIAVGGARGLDRSAAALAAPLPIESRAIGSAWPIHKHRIRRSKGWPMDDIRDPCWPRTTRRLRLSPIHLKRRWGRNPNVAAGTRVNPRQMLKISAGRQQVRPVPRLTL
jgi:hypothetical protein